MSLADLLHKPQPTGPEATVARLTAELEDAKARAEAANAAWAEALANEQENGGADTSASDRLDDELSRALREVKKLSKALEATQTRQQTAQAGAVRDATAVRWAEAEALAVERNTIVTRAAESIQRLADDFQAIQELSIQIVAALPVCPDQVGAQLQGGQLQGALSRELRRLGLEGPQVAATLWNAAPFASYFEGVPDLIHRWAESAMGASAGKVTHA